jgi:predicted nuclease of predicted toxin-antitoxin system
VCPSQQQILGDYPQLEPEDFLARLVPESESALRNGLACIGDRRILDYAAAHGFMLISTDSDFERRRVKNPGAKIVILRACELSTDVAAEVLRRSAIRIAELPASRENLIILDQSLPAVTPLADARIARAAG